MHLHTRAATTGVNMALQQQPQRRGRRFMLCPQRPENKQQLVVRVGGNLQPPQMCAARIRQPGQHSRHVSALQRFTRGPQQCRGQTRLRVRVNAKQAMHADLAGAQCGAERQIRRACQRQPGLPAVRFDTRGLQASQHRCQQAPFMLTGLRLQHFHHGPLWPAATGQFTVQLGVTGVKRWQVGAANLTGAPNVGSVQRSNAGQNRRYGIKQSGHGRKAIL